MTQRARRSVKLVNLSAAILVAMLLLARPAAADSIAVGDTRYEDAYITEGASLYYVSLADTGTTITIAKDDPALGPVEITADESEREIILARYKEVRSRLATPDEPGTAANVTRTNFVESSIDSSTFRMSSATVRAESSATPLLVLRGNAVSRPSVPAPSRQSGPQLNGGGSQGGFNSGGTMQSAGRRSGGAGGGRAGGGGGRGAGRGGGQTGTGAGFTNISELFSTIDDADVGEAPNPIAGGAGRIGNF